MTERPALPGWPRGMPEQLAAAYVGLSVSRFQACVVPEVAGIQITERIRIWVKDDLDDWLDRLSGRVPSSGGINPWDRVLR